MKRALLVFALVLSYLMPGAALRGGVVGSTLGRYSLGGAGIGALLGSATATVSYLNSRQPFDFLTGAGAGCAVGAGVGLIFGIIDLATMKDEAPAEGQQGSVPMSGVFAFSAGSANYLAWKTVF